MSYDIFKASLIFAGTIKEGTERFSTRGGLFGGMGGACLSNHITSVLHTELEFKKCRDDVLILECSALAPKQTSPSGESYSALLDGTSKN